MGNASCDCAREGTICVAQELVKGDREDFPSSCGTIVEEEAVGPNNFVALKTLSVEHYSCSRSISKEWTTATASTVLWTEATTTPDNKHMENLDSLQAEDTDNPTPRQGLTPEGSPSSSPRHGHNVLKWQTAVLTVKWAGFNQFDSGPSPQQAGVQEQKASGNQNKPQDFVWLRNALGKLIRNEGRQMGATDMTTGKEYTPIFFVLGGCPNALCGMQAVVYCVDCVGEVDFWWVKPQKGNPNELENETLSRHSKGPHKNDPGRSYQFYKPLADLFTDSGIKQGWRFGIEKVKSRTGEEAFRAYIQTALDNKKGKIGRLYVHMFWQEDWTTNPFASKKYIKGKIVYQKLVNAAQFFSRQYEIHDGTIIISGYEEPAFSSIIPSDDLKRIFALSTS